MASDKPWLDYGTPSSDVKTDEAKQPLDNQGARFAADTAARGAGLFAGYPVDTIQNLINLGIAAVGSYPAAIAKGAEYLPSVVGAPLGALASTLEAKWPKPSLISALPGGSEQITRGYRNLLSLTGSPTEGVAPTGPAQAFAGDVGAMALGGAGSVQSKVDAAKLALSALGATAGQRSASAMAPDSNLAPVIGSLIGGVAMPAVYGSGGPAVNTVRSLLNQSDKARPIAENIIQSQLRSAASGLPEAPQNIENALALQSKFPGVNLSVAEMAGTPGLSAMQAAYASQRPQNLNAELARQRANLSALSSAAEERIPQSSVTGSEPRNILNRSLAAQGADIAGEQANLAGSLTNQPQQPIGQSLIDAATKLREQAKANLIRPLYESVFKEAGSRTIDVSNVLDDASKILGRKLSDFAPETAPLTVRALQTFEPKKPQYMMFGQPLFGSEQAQKPVATLQQLDDVRKAVNADIATAKSSYGPMADTTLRNLYKLHDSIDEAVAQSSLPESVKTGYAKALSTYRDVYAPVFKEGVNAKLFRTTSLNEPGIKPDDVVRTYFQPGGEREAGQFVKMFGGNPDAIATARTGIMDLFRQEVVDPVTGTVSPAKTASFGAKYARPIEIMDKAGMGIGDALRSTANRAAELADRQATLSDVAQRLNFESSDKLKSAVLSSRKTMGLTLDQMDKPSAAALTNSILEDAVDAIRKGEGSKAETFLADNEQTIRMAMSKAEGSQVATTHFKDLQDISKIASMIESADVKGRLGAAASTDPLRKATGVSIPTVWAQTRAVMAGRQGLGTAIAMVAGPALTRLSQVQFDDIMNNALHNPQTARALAEYLKSSPQQAEGKAAMLMRVWDAAKQTAKAAPGFIGTNWLGLPNYGPTAARIAPSFAQQGSQAAQ